MAYRAVKASLITLCLAPSAWAYEALSGETFAAMDGMFDQQVMEMPEVLTAARLRQSQLDTPASVTVIEADTIAALGFKDIEEIFRLVPGMLVGYHSGVGEKAPSVSYHGTNAPEHRRLQVLIDGRSVFKPGLARVEWVDIPLAVEDIARIEVIRGPNSAAYGANSYLGTINILTKHPQDEKSTTVKLTAGTRNVQDAYVNIASNLFGTDVRWTFGSKQKSGFDVLDNGDNNRDDIEAVYSTLRTYTQLSPLANMQLQAGYKTGTNEQRRLYESLISYNTEEDIDAEDYYFWSKFSVDLSSSQSAHLQLYTQKFNRTIKWDACFPGAFIGSPEPALCGLFDKSLYETKTEVEYQHTSIWNPSFRTVSGARVRLDEFESESYNDGYSKNTNTSVFANGEVKFAKMLTLNVGGMYEEDNLNGSYFAPRLAFNLHMTDKDTLRLIYSEAIRSPDLYEQNGQLVFNVKNIRLPDGAPQDDGILEYGTVESELDFERIYSHEISYFGLYPSLSAQLDVKLFYDNLTGLISESLEHDKEITNSNQLHQSGIEGQFKVALNSYNDLMLTFALLDVDDDFARNKDSNGELTKEAERESSLSADTSASLVWLNRFDAQTRFSTALYHVNDWNPYVNDKPGGYEFFRVDFTASRDMVISPGYVFTLESTLQYRIDDDPLVRDKNNYEDDHFVYVSGQLKF